MVPASQGYCEDQIRNTVGKVLSRYCVMVDIIHVCVY